MSSLTSKKNIILPKINNRDFLNEFPTIPPTKKISKARNFFSWFEIEEALSKKEA
jgi:hypothetical protein